MHWYSYNANENKLHFIQNKTSTIIFQWKIWRRVIFWSYNLQKVTQSFFIHAWAKFYSEEHLYEIEFCIKKSIHEIQLEKMQKRKMCIISSKSIMFTAN